MANLLAQAEMAGDKSRAAVEGGSAVGARLQSLLEQEDTSSKLSPLVNTVTLQDLGDELYGGVYEATEVPGPYRVIVKIEGENPHLGTYHRAATATVLVLAGRPDVDMSDFSVTQTTIQKGMRNVFETNFQRPIINPKSAFRIPKSERGRSPPQADS